MIAPNPTPCTNGKDDRKSGKRHIAMGLFLLVSLGLVAGALAQWF